MRCRLCIAVVLLSAFVLQDRAEAQAPSATPTSDPLRRGYALLIGNSRYQDRRWSQLDDIPLQLASLERSLKDHFDKVEVAQNLDAEQLRQKIKSFLRTRGNDFNARLFIYYAGHGYTEAILPRDEYRGYITGIDTPAVDATRAYDEARPRAISMLEIRASLEDAVAKHILVMFDSCFAGTIFSTRGGADTPRPLIPDIVARLMEKPARDFITAGRSNERVPARSPIPDLFLAALNGAADRYQHGVVSASEIHTFLLSRVSAMPDIVLTPQQGRLPHPSFAEGAFLFRVINSTFTKPDESETIRLYRDDAAKGDAVAQVTLGYLYSAGKGGLTKNEGEAARLYRLAADQGNARAQAALGFYYAIGKAGLPKDEREAARLYRLAADQGHARAQGALGFYYAAGKGGLPKNEREAVRLYRLSAEQGASNGQANLGLAYELGRSGLPKDEREAVRLYRLSAEQGDGTGQANLGRFYDQGRGGLPKDEREAVRLFRLAADGGNAAAQFNLGAYHEQGKGGLPKDKREAVRLYKLAAEQGNTQAQSALDRLGR